VSGWSTIRSGVAGHRDALVESLHRTEDAQSQLLQRILRRNRDTEFGTHFDFAEIATVEEYQERVPLQDYDDIRVDIVRMMDGEKNLRCADEIVLFEQTGGSTGGSKFLPFTDASLKAVRRAVLPWLDDLLQSYPGITAGKAYWAISPATRQQSCSKGGIPIGIDNDAMYFGDPLAQAIGETLAVPPTVAAIESVDEWRTTTLRHLLDCTDLSFVSVWSPTFFLQLIDAVDSDVAARWPMLDTISCWSSASSRRYACELSERFPAVTLQGKGLLATEGVVTVPLCAAIAPVLAIESGFFEFVDDDGDILLAQQLETNATYSVVMTTEAGLYRYRLGDRVLVKGWFGDSPCLEYVGREGGGSDLCGEKLTVEFVDAVLGDMPGFAFLVPVAGERPFYCLVLNAALVAEEQIDELVNYADKQLSQNPQYQYARDIGQLAALKARRLNDPVAEYERICVESGQRLGDIKPTTIASLKWSETFMRANAA
jgi:hypothetical protein